MEREHVNETSPFDKPFSIEGNFWVPREPKHEPSATLVFEPTKRLHLNLVNRAAFQGKEKKRYPGEIIPIIHGFMRDFNYATLLNSTLRPGSKGPGAYSEINYMPDTVLIYPYFGNEKRHLISGPSELFSEIQCSFERLDSWLGIRMWDLTSKPKPFSKERTTKISWEVWSPLGIEYSLDDCHVIFDRDVSDLHKVGCQVRYVDRPLMILRPHEPKTYDWFIRRLFELFRFWSFMLKAEVNPNYLRLRTKRRVKLDKRKELRYLEPLLFHWSYLHQEPKPRDYYEMLPSYDLLENHFQEIFQKWFTQLPQFEPLLLAILACQRGALGAPLFELLVLVMAIESYYSSSNRDKVYSNPEFSNELRSLLSNELKSCLKEAIPKRCPEFLYSIIDARLKHIDQISLRDKIHSLILSIPFKSRGNIFGNEEEFSRVVANIRNDAVHGLGTSVEKGRYNLIHSLAERLKVLCTLLIFDEVGIKGYEAGKAIEVCYRLPKLNLNV